MESALIIFDEFYQNRIDSSLASKISDIEMRNNNVSFRNKIF